MDIDYAVDSSVDPHVLKSRVARILRLQEYADGFTGPAKVQRLLFLAELCEGEDIALEALKMAHDDIKSHSIDSELYKRVVQLIQAKVDGYIEDAEWIERCDDAFFSEQADIEARLVSAKSALDQPTIASLEGEYGDVLYRRGASVDALKHYARMRDYSKSTEDFLSMTYRSVRCAFHSKNFFSVLTHARKMESMKQAHQGDAIKLGQVRLMAALTQAILGKFDVAARSLSQISHDIISSSPDIISVESFGLCMALCAMATMGRTELESLMNSAPGFQEILDQASQDVHDAILAHRAAHYGEALSLLEAVKPYAWVDYILSQHISELYSMIHDRCLCEYSSAFSTVSLSYMADTLNIKPSDLEHRVVSLIEQGRLRATVDGQTNQIRIKQTSVKAKAFKSAIEAAHMFLRDSKFIILRSGMLRYGLAKPGMQTTSFSGTIDVESHEPAGEDQHQAGSSQIETGDMSDYKSVINRVILGSFRHEEIVRQRVYETRGTRHENLQILADRLYLSKGITVTHESSSPAEDRQQSNVALKRCYDVRRKDEAAHDTSSDDETASQGREDQTCRAVQSPDNAVGSTPTPSPGRTRMTRVWDRRPWLEKYMDHKQALQAVGRWGKNESTLSKRPRVFRKRRNALPQEKAMSQRLSNLLYRKRQFDDACQEFHDFYFAELGYDFRQDWEQRNSQRRKQNIRDVDS